jgi:hypothetical protein
VTWRSPYGIHYLRLRIADNITAGGREIITLVVIVFFGFVIEGAGHGASVVHCCTLPHARNRPTNSYAGGVRADRQHRAAPTVLDRRRQDVPHRPGTVRKYLSPALARSPTNPATMQDKFRESGKKKGKNLKDLLAGNDTGLGGEVGLVI